MNNAIHLPQSTLHRATRRIATATVAATIVAAAVVSAAGAKTEQLPRTVKKPARVAAVVHHRAPAHHRTTKKAAVQSPPPVPVDVRPVFAVPAVVPAPPESLATPAYVDGLGKALSVSVPSTVSAPAVPAASGAVSPSPSEEFVADHTPTPQSPPSEGTPTDWINWY